MALDPSKRLTSHKALNTGKRALETGQRALVALPKQTRALVQRIPKPVQLQLKHYSRRSALIGFEVLIGVLIIGFVAGALVNSRLKEGPISLTFLVTPLEQAINRELSGLSVDIEDVVLRRSPRGSGFEFRLLNLQMKDEQSDVVAQAPLAAIALSGRSLLSGTIAPGSVELIGPRVTLFYREDRGLALSFSRPDPVGDLLQSTEYQSSVKLIRLEGKAETIAERRPLKPMKEASASRQIDLVPAVYDAFERARRNPTVSTYLTRFGFRDAVVAFDLDGEQSLWHVPDFSVNLEHRKKQSIIRGSVNLQGDGRDWNMRFRTEQSDRSRSLIFTMLFDDVVPRAVSQHFEKLSLLKALDMPLQGQASITVNRKGDIKGAQADLQLAAGDFVTSWAHQERLKIDGGNVTLRYNKKSGKIELLPSTFRWGESRATFQGAVVTKPKSGGDSWEFSVKATDAALATEEFGTSVAPVQEWSVRGWLNPSLSQVRLEDYRLLMPNGGMQFSGTVTKAEGSPEIIGEGMLSAKSAETLKRIWTPLLAPVTRRWVGLNLLKVGVATGKFKLAIPGGVLAKAEKEGGEIPDSAAHLALDVSNISLRVLETMPPLEAENAKITIAGRKFVFDVPDAAIKLPSGKMVEAKSGQFVIDDLRPEVPIGELRVKTNASLGAALELLNYKPFEVLDNTGIEAAKYNGEATSEFTLKIPLKEETYLKDINVEGIAKVRRLSGKDVLGPISIEGGAIDFGLSDKAIDARGDLILNGVPAKLSWQRIFDANDNRQPAVRISGVFDDSARKQLGLPADHLLRGDLPAVLSITRGADNERNLHLEANLSNCSLTLSDMGWHKPVGQDANLSFDIATSKWGTTELKNFTINGDKIGISGWLRFDKKGQLIAYGFPEFSYNVISRLEIQGEKAKDGIWKVKAQSSTYDGRQFFKALFSGGRLTKNQAEQTTFSKGIDLEASFGTMIGHFDSSIHNVRVKMRKRSGRLVDFNATGSFQNGKVISADLQSNAGPPRIITSTSDDAGQAFRLVGFFPKLEGGQAILRVNLDGQGAASTIGTLEVRDFVIIGQQISLANDAGGKRHKKQNVAYQKFDFDRMSLPFSVGHGQFVLHDSQINGPLLGATMRGVIDFERDRMDLGGTYVPLFGLNSIPGQIPIVGGLFRGRQGEGLLGVTFAVQGSVANPQVLVNPVSVAAPGIFRQIFEMSPNAPRVREREKPPGQ